MYHEFRNLYEYLADPISSDSMQDNRPADGGLCVLQNVTAFDRRHKYASLPHPLPLVPEIPISMTKHKSNRRLKLFGNRQANFDHRLEAYAALSAATNSSSLSVMECTLVREYLYFEKVWTMKESETVTCAEARKVRWILIYSILQTLISVTQSPKEVKDTEGVSYPLCCQTAGTPPWKNGLKSLKSEERQGVSSAETPTRGKEIKPDVEYSGQEHPQLDPQHTSSPRKISTGPVLNPDPLHEPLKTSSCESPFTPCGENMHSSGCEADSNPSTPSSATTSRMASEEGWSSNSSEDDGMEHLSVAGSLGNNEWENGEDDDDQLFHLQSKTSLQ